MRCGCAIALLLFALNLNTFPLAAQVNTISGYVEDVTSGERIPGAAFYIPALGTGVISNQYGFYSLSIASPTVRFVVSHLAYAPATYDLTIEGDTTLMVLLTPRVIGMAAVEVVAEGESSVESVQMSVHDVQIKQIETLPVLLGEVDIQKTLQLLPGVQSGLEGTTGLYVRGGRPDQNLTLMDGVPLYNPAHIFGFVSVFNAPAMKRVEFIKGAFPARYGGRLSSVVNYTMKEGNMKEYAGEASIGLVSTRVMAEGPLKKEKASFIVAGRRSYADALAAPFFIDREARPIAYFYDLNAKANAILSPRDRIYLSGFAGQDKFGAVNKDNNGGLRGDVRWHNRLLSLRWNHQLGDRLFANTLVGITNYRLGVHNNQWDESGGVRWSFESTYRTEIVDWIGKLDFEYGHSQRHFVRFGAEGTIHRFNPGTSSVRISSSEDGVEESMWSATGKLKSTELALYAEDELLISRRLRASIGLRLSGYLVKGKQYGSVEPRLAVHYRVSETMAAKASWASATQYVHLLNLGALALPSDLWVPSLGSIKPQRGFQAAAGVVRTFSDNMYEVSVEAYLKRISNYLEYKDGAGALESVVFAWDELVTPGTGEAYGLELFLQKKAGRLTGWLGYTLAKATRTVAALNRGKPYRDSYDRRHDVAVVGQYKLLPRLLASAAWIYGSGYPLWVPIGRYEVRNNEYDYHEDVVHYGPINSARSPASHRLDVSMQYRWDRPWGGHAVQLGFYNTYARKNPTVVFYEVENDIITFKKLSLLALVPSLSYQVRF